jgi:hypothetical protein
MPLEYRSVKKSYSIKALTPLSTYPRYSVDNSQDWRTKKMPIIKTPFDQSKYLSSDEPGICNALVLEWLYSNGRPLRFMRRTIKRARGYYDITGDDAFLWLKKKILGARIKHDYREFLVYELS